MYVQQAGLLQPQLTNGKSSVNTYKDFSWAYLFNISKFIFDDRTSLEFIILAIFQILQKKYQNKLFFEMKISSVIFQI